MGIYLGVVKFRLGTKGAVFGTFTGFSIADGAQMDFIFLK